MGLIWNHSCLLKHDGECFDNNKKYSGLIMIKYSECVLITEKHIPDFTTQYVINTYSKFVTNYSRQVLNICIDVVKTFVLNRAEFYPAQSETCTCSATNLWYK